MPQIASLFSFFLQDLRGNGMQCARAEQSDIERHYHDTEWGQVLRDDRGLFELLTLRGAQAGLAWHTVLGKRERYRQLFHDYDIPRIAAMSDAELDAIRQDRGVIRNRLKLASVRCNARAALRVVETGSSLSDLLWSFAEQGAVGASSPRDVNGFTPSRSDASDRMSLALRKRGFRFAGTAICFAIMQSAGMIESHAVGCSRRR